MINYYIIKIEGKYLDHYINRLIRLNVNLIDMKYVRNGILIKVSYDDYEKIKDIVTINKFKIIKISGYRKIKIILKNYSIFFIFLFFSFIVLLFLFRITFFINVNGVSEDFKKTILDELNRASVSCYSFDKSFDEYKDIAKSIKNKYKDNIEWIEIVNNGISLDINIIPRKDNVLEKESIKSNIVALKNGIIKDIISDKGQILKEREDYVKKGDIIVSGVIYRNGKAVDIVDASAKVYAEVWYKVKVNSSYYVDTRVIKYSKTNIYLDFLGKKIKLMSSIKHSNNLEDTNIYKGLFFNIYRDDKLYYEVISLKKNESELKSFLLNEARLAIFNTLSDDEEILMEKPLKIYNNNGKMYVEVFIKTYENIAGDVEILETDLENYSE